MVGAAGFEPTITGSKPDALPLGYAPKYTGVLVISAGSIPSLLELQCVFTAQKAMRQKIVEINHKLQLIIVYQRIRFPLFDK